MESRTTDNDIIHLLRVRSNSAPSSIDPLYAMCGKGGKLDRAETIEGGIVESKLSWPFKPLFLTGDLAQVTCERCITLKDEYQAEFRKHEIAQGLRCASCDHSNSLHIEQEGPKHYGQKSRFSCRIPNCSCQDFADARPGLYKESWIDGAEMIVGGFVKAVVVVWVATDIIGRIVD